MRKTYNQPRLFIAYVLGYLLLMEWLFPLPFITDIGYISVFMGAAAFFFIIMFLRLPWWAVLIFLSSGILYAVHMIFFNSSFFGAEWWGYLLEDVVQNIEYFISGNWHGLSDLHRSMLFLILLAVMSYLIYFWIIHARRILFFFICTVIYLGIMDTFFPYDGQLAIARAFVIGFLLLALLQWDRLSMFFSGERSWKGWMAWVLVSLSVLIIAMGVGITAPKADPQWPDPVPYLKTAIGLENGMQMDSDKARVIGYGDNDEKLGGGFSMDDTPVFTATGELGGYWRGESKNVYTGQGWTSNTPHESMKESKLYTADVPQAEKEVQVEMKSNFRFPFAFYPGEFQSLKTAEADVKTEVSRHSGKASLFVDGEDYQPQHYSIQYEDPEFPIEKMKKTPKEDPKHIKEHYLSLPEDLPTEVEELAEKLTADENNRYDKVKAIESFFHGPDFTYDTQDIPVPEEGEDYVAQFLFETRRGYCDNFSTSMAVMLRSLDIPTRWVKGFTEGEKIETESGGAACQVTNANAHSWVEVYFPEVGWVPFEPTKGFSAEFMDYEAGASANEEESQQEQEENQEPEEEEEEKQENENAPVSTSWFSGWFLLVIAAVCLLLFLVVFMYRLKLYKKMVLFWYRDVDGEESYTKAFHSLLWFLKQAGYKKAGSETLREFAERIDEVFETTDMTILTHEYEKIHYGNKKGKIDEVVPTWRSMVERVNT